MLPAALRLAFLGCFLWFATAARAGTLNDLVGPNGFIPAGTYQVSGTGILPGTSVRGAGMGKTILVLSSALAHDYDGAIQAIGTDNWSISDLTIDMKTLQGAGISTFQSNGWRVENVNFANVLNYGLFSNGCLGWKAIHCYFFKPNPTGTFQNQAIIVSNSGGNTGDYDILSNRCNGFGMLLSGIDCNVTGNRIKNVRYGSGIALNFDTQRFVVSKNICEGGRGTDINNTIISGFELWGIWHSVQGNIAFNNDAGGFQVWCSHSNVNGNLGYHNALVSKDADFVLGHLDLTHNANYTLFTDNYGSRKIDPKMFGLQQYGNF